MVTITDRARAHVRKLIQDNNLGDVHLRFSVTGGGCSGFNYNLTFAAEPEKGDQLLEFGELKVFVDKLSRLYVNDTQIDWEETLYGSGFTFSNPKAKSTCGCGQSFSVEEQETGADAQHSH